jgi:Na+/citrate or Na+/malate symporter
VQTKKTNQKTENKKTKKNKETKKLGKIQVLIYFCFFSLVILPICLFFCGEPVFDYVVNVFFVGCHFFATINLLCSRWPQNAKQQVH